MHKCMQFAMKMGMQVAFQFCVAPKQLKISSRSFQDCLEWFVAPDVALCTFVYAYVNVFSEVTHKSDIRVISIIYL